MSEMTPEAEGRLNALIEILLQHPETLADATRILNEAWRAATVIRYGAKLVAECDSLLDNTTAPEVFNPSGCDNCHCAAGRGWDGAICECPCHTSHAPDGMAQNKEQAETSHE